MACCRSEYVIGSCLFFTTLTVDFIAAGECARVRVVLSLSLLTIACACSARV
jgi:hypothetical protein